MTDRPSPFLRFAVWLQGCGLLFLLLGMALALLAAGGNFLLRTLAAPSAPLVLLGAAGYLALATAAVAALALIYRKLGSAAFLWAAILSSVLLQLTIILSTPLEWRWTNDAAIFRYYLNHLADSGYGPDSLAELSRYYDYRIWPRRAQPFYLFLHKMSTRALPRAIPCFQMILIAGSLGLTWRLARLLFGHHVAFWATTLQWAMPFRWLSAIDLNHHLLGGFYYLAGLWILAEWYAAPPTAWRRGGLLLGALLLLPLMRLEGGIDLVFLFAATGVILLQAATWRTPRGSRALALAALVGLPLLTTLLVLRPLDRRLDQADRHRHESGRIAYMARGWSPETGGEYTGTYEMLDVATPLARKKPAQAAILASQAFYNPLTILFRLLPMKMAKFFLLGYSSGAEEMVVANHAYQAKALATGARIAFALASLPFMIWGGVLLFPRLRGRRGLIVLLPCAAISATFILLGETSPRYSIYVQPFLFLLGALPLSWSRLRQGRMARAAVAPALGSAASVAAAFGLASLLLVALRPALRRAAFLDLRQWEIPASVHSTQLPPTLSPLEIQLSPSSTPEGTEWGPVDIPGFPRRPGAITCYAFPVGVAWGWARQIPLHATLQSSALTSRQTNSLPGYFRLPYSEGACGRLVLHTPLRFPYPLRIGYAAYEFDEN